MNCSEVQLKFPEILREPKKYSAEMTHVKNCKNCKSEFNVFKLMSSSIQNMNDQIPLIVSRQNQKIINSKIERKNFANRMRILTSVAAVLIVSLISIILYQQSEQGQFYYDNLNVNDIAYSDADVEMEFELSEEEILDYLITSENTNNLDEIVEDKFSNLENKNGS
ncbi:MAG: hypothetical protein PF551_01955 [Candidatus Marinimicrobia bacterium]|jgi:hypothetical protein|nr:hypothetical protein [Candidatus Neomarinimicrobiota bacterium]